VTRILARIVPRAGAAAVAAALLGLAAGPALAAGTAARATANAAELTVAGNSQGTGIFTASDAGRGQQTAGSNQPALTVLGGQDVVTAGTLFQDATAGMRHHRAHAAGCAGLAGDGATLVRIGDSRCITPTQNLRLDLGKVDLAKLVANTKIVDNQQLDAALAPVKDQLTGGLKPVLDQLNAALDQARSRLGDAGLFLDLDAIQGVCHASPGRATGSADLADVALYAQVPGHGRVYLAELPVAPPPNTQVPVQLHVLLDAVTAGLKKNFATILQGQLAPVNGGLDKVQQQAIDNAVAQLDQQLQPVADNVVNLTLNEQSRPTPSSIRVTALDLNVLPAANAQAGMTVLNLRVGTVTCGASGELVSAPAAAPRPKHQARHAVPRAVPAGLATMPTAARDDHSAGPLLAGSLGVLLLACGVAGTTAWHRRLGG
jgi:hypothetical protein